jgi:hypothetical protein
VLAAHAPMRLERHAHAPHSSHRRTAPPQPIRVWGKPSRVWGKPSRVWPPLSRHVPKPADAKSRPHHVSARPRATSGRRMRATPLGTVKTETPPRMLILDSFTPFTRVKPKSRLHKPFLPSHHRRRSSPWPRPPRAPPPSFPSPHGVPPSHLSCFRRRAVAAASPYGRCGRDNERRRELYHGSAADARGHRPGLGLDASQPLPRCTRPQGCSPVGTRRNSRRRAPHGRWGRHCFDCVLSRVFSVK